MGTNLKYLLLESFTWLFIQIIAGDGYASASQEIFILLYKDCFKLRFGTVMIGANSTCMAILRWEGLLKPFSATQV